MRTDLGSAIEKCILYNGSHFTAAYILMCTYIVTVEYSNIKFFEKTDFCGDEMSDRQWKKILFKI